MRKQQKRSGKGGVKGATIGIRFRNFSTFNAPGKLLTFDILKRDARERKGVSGRRERKRRKEETA